MNDKQYITRFNVTTELNAARYMCTQCLFIYPTGHPNTHRGEAFVYKLVPSYTPSVTTDEPVKVIPLRSPPTQDRSDHIDPNFTFQLSRSPDRKYIGQSST